MASVITQTVYFNGDNWKVIKLACTAHTDGSFDSVNLSSEVKTVVRDWGLYKAEVNVGTTPPTASSDLAITDFVGHDVLGGAGENQITTSDTEFAPLIGTQPAVQPFVGGDWTVAITNNSVNGALFDIYLYFKKWGW